MRKALKVFLPVLAGLSLPFIYDRIDSFLSPPNPEDYGDGGMLSLWAFSHIMFPITILVLCVFQKTIIIPLYNKVTVKQNFTMTKILINVIIICVVFGLIFGYIFWEPRFGLHDLIISVCIMTGLQLIYWISNILTLYLDMPHIPNSMFKAR